jgi:hypothetical protein
MFAKAVAEDKAVDRVSRKSQTIKVRRGYKMASGVEVGKRVVRRLKLVQQRR